MRPEEAYAELIDRAKRIALLNSASGLLGWDQRTYLPAKGHGYRAEQLALLAGLSHEWQVDPRIGELLEALEGSLLVLEPAAAPAVNFREIRRAYRKACRLPRRLVEAFSRTRSLATTAWETARRESDFGLLRPWLEELVRLAREKADALGWQEHRYDALLDLYEPYATTSQVREIFGPLRAELTGLLGGIAGARNHPDLSVLEGDFPVALQAQFCGQVAAAIGFDMQGGRLDETVHPFCSGIGPGDVRLTTRYHPRYLTGALYGTLHEAGHGLYHQGLDPAHVGTPMGQYISLGIHESQSRMWENQVGRSRAFLRWLLPKAAGVFPCLSRVDLQAYYFALNAARPSFIRVEADEATYNLHIMLRFDLEVELIGGGLAVSEIPAAWNRKFKEYFGQEVPSDRVGCLQDVHWSSGLFGYFPTYALGNLYAAQFFEQARQDLGDLYSGFAAGDFRPLLEWLKAAIHSVGMQHSASALCEKRTGRPLSHRALIEHLRSKLVPLYGI